MVYVVNTLPKRLTDVTEPLLHEGRVCPQGRVYPQGILEWTEASDCPLIALPWDWINAGVITDTNLVAVKQGTPECKNNEDKSYLMI